MFENTNKLTIRPPQIFFSVKEESIILLLVGNFGYGHFHQMTRLFPITNFTFLLKKHKHITLKLGKGNPFNICFICFSLNASLITNNPEQQKHKRMMFIYVIQKLMNDFMICETCLQPAICQIDSKRY